MARENQSLQIALILFVLFTLVFAAGTFVFYRMYDEATIREKAASDKARTAEGALATRDTDIKVLKGLITPDQTIDVSGVQELFNKDMKAFGQRYADEDRFYNKLVAVMQKAMDDKNKELKTAKDENRDLDEKFKERERSKDAQMKTLEEERQKAVADRDNEVAKFRTDRTRLTEYQATLERELKEMRKTAVVRVKELEEKLGEEKKRDEVIDRADRQARQYYRADYNQDHDGPACR